LPLPSPSSSNGDDDISKMIDNYDKYCIAVVVDDDVAVVVVVAVAVVVI